MLKHIFLSSLIAITLISASGCDTLNSLRMMQINSNVKPVINSTQPIALKASFLGEKPYINANVNGEELLFLIDTGASFLILFDTPKVKAMKLPEGFPLSLSGWGEEESTKAYQTDIDSFNMAEVQFNGLKAAYIPISTSPYFLRADEALIDGVIGHDMLKHFIWQFDKSKNSITVGTQPYQANQHTESFEIDTFLSKISIEGTLVFNEEENATGDFIIDTGSRHYLKISSQFTENRDIVIDSESITAADFGLNGKVEHERVTLPALRLGSLKIPNIKTNLIPSKDEDEDDFWVIGNALLNQYKTVIDYPNDKMYLEPQKKISMRYNLLGLELRKIRSGEFVIRYIFPNFPVSKHNLKVGDLVTKISNIPTTETTTSYMLNISATPGIKQVCIQRDNLCFEIATEKVVGYSAL